MPKLISRRQLEALDTMAACKALADWLQAIEKLSYTRRRDAQVIFLNSMPEDGWTSTRLVAASDMAETWNWLADAPDRGSMIDALADKHDASELTTSQQSMRSDTSESAPADDHHSAADDAGALRASFLLSFGTCLTTRTRLQPPRMASSVARAS